MWVRWMMMKTTTTAATKKTHDSRPSFAAFILLTTMEYGRTEDCLVLSSTHKTDRRPVELWKRNREDQKSLLTNHRNGTLLVGRLSCKGRLDSTWPTTSSRGERMMEGLRLMKIADSSGCDLRMFLMHI